jgi:hypothetical protein
VYIRRFLLSNSLCPSLRSVVLAALSAGLLVACSFAQNPVPQIVGPVHPDAVAPGGGDFTLSVYGANFVPGAVVNWNYQSRTTTYVSGHELQAQILSTDIAENTAGYITITNPAPGGGSSSASWAQVEVHDPISTITFNQPLYAYFGFWELLSADFNHDATLDLLGEYDGLGLEVGRGNGTFKTPTVLDPSNEGMTQFGYGDFNNDGNIDVVSFSDLDALGYQSMHMRMLFGDGKGHFTHGPGLTGDGSNFGEVTVGDFNRDGNLDLVTKSYWLSSYLGNGDGTFRWAELDRVNENQAVLLSGDIDGDGVLDLILVNESSVLNGTLSFVFLRGNGDGSFQKGQTIVSLQNTYSCGFVPGLQLSDFNGDGKLDLAFCTGSQVVVLLGNGNGTFRLGSAITVDPNNDRDFTFTVGDINSDGKQDLIVNEYHDLNYQLAIYLGNGDGTFQPPQTMSTISAESGMVPGDLNKDGLLDLVFQTGLGMEVYIQP